VRRFLAAFYPDAELERTTLSTEVEGERFTTVVLSCWRLAGRRLTSQERKADYRRCAEAVEATPPVQVQDAVETRQAETLKRSIPRPRAVILTPPCSGPWRRREDDR
jgi:DNA topoisomerase IA